MVLTMKSSIFFTLLFVFFQIKFWVSKDGVFQLRKINQCIASQKALNHQLSVANAQLEYRIKLMQLNDHHPFAEQKHALIEDYARQKFGLVKSDEILYYW